LVAVAVAVELSALGRQTPTQRLLAVAGALGKYCKRN
jgi:hypothetical protein